MGDSSVQFKQMTIATTRTAEMVRFYDALFGTAFRATEAFGTTLYDGTLAGIPVTLCPNEIAAVEAEQSRHQLALRVADLAGLLRIVAIAGGGIDTVPTESAGSAILRDPDGNTIEVIQA